MFVGFISDEHDPAFYCSRNITPTVHCWRRQRKSFYGIVLFHRGQSVTTIVGRACVWRPTIQQSAFVVLQQNILDVKRRRVDSKLIKIVLVHSYLLMCSRGAYEWHVRHANKGKYEMRVW